MKKVQVITDGACLGNPGRGGWAAILVYGEHRKELFGCEPHTTNNRMELRAAIEGLRALREQCEIEVVTDSEYVKNGITQWIANWKKRGWINRRRSRSSTAICGKRSIAKSPATRFAGAGPKATPRMPTTIARMSLPRSRHANSAARRVSGGCSAANLNAIPRQSGFVPQHARARRRARTRDAALNPQRLGNDRVPPVRVLQIMRRGRQAHELRADLRPQVVRNRNAVRLGERRRAQPSGHATDLHHVRHDEVGRTVLNRRPHVMRTPPVLAALD